MREWIVVAKPSAEDINGIIANRQLVGFELVPPVQIAAGLDGYPIYAATLYRDTEGEDQ